MVREKGKMITLNSFYEMFEYSMRRINPPPLPFDPDKKIFFQTDDEGNVIGAPYSYNEWVQRLNDISGVDEEMLGKA
jgi:hypothetical protein